MIPERIMAYPKWIKVLILAFTIIFLMPVVIIYFTLKGIIISLAESFDETFGMIKSLPNDCYEFIKYSSYKEKRDDYWKRIKDEVAEDE